HLIITFLRSALRRPASTLFPYTTLFRSGLVQGQKAFDTLTVTSFDGTASHDISVEINGTNDAPAIKGTTSETYVSSGIGGFVERSEEHTSELQSRENLVCRLLLEHKNRR